MVGVITYAGCLDLNFFLIASLRTVAINAFLETPISEAATSNCLSSSNVILSDKVFFLGDITLKSPPWILL